MLVGCKWLSACAGLHRDLVALAVHGAAEVLQQDGGGIDIHQPRDVVEAMGAVGQQRGEKQGQSGVLGTPCCYFSREGMPTIDDDSVQGSNGKSYRTPGEGYRPKVSSFP
jgi:hypothetical protein